MVIGKLIFRLFSILFKSLMVTSLLIISFLYPSVYATSIFTLIPMMVCALFIAEALQPRQMAVRSSPTNP